MRDPKEKKLAEIAKKDEHISYKQVTTQPKKGVMNWLVGRPLPSADAPHQTIGKAVGLAVFASDALSSTAYATQEILVILALAGAGAFGLSIPLSIAIVVLLVIVTISYEQTIHAYPGGGGAYIVARENLGELPAQTAGASLLTDYILTVAVSVSSGIAQLVSAFPQLLDFQVELAVAAVFFIMAINLRGVKESGMAFSIPTYFFIIMLFLTVGIGFFRFVTGSLGQLTDPPELHLIGPVTGLTAFLVLRAFASGTAALTGIEAISNGITAFKEPRSRNAGITLLWMSAILSVLFLSVTFLSNQIGAVPSETETVISQIARTVYNGRNLLYLGTVAATTIILIMAANTAFADFPRLSAIQAGDGFLPRQLTYRGSRLVYSRGIALLAVVASLIIILFKASVTALIPLYAIGVFLSFTLSQVGMARRWWKVGKLANGKSRKKKATNGDGFHAEELTYDPRWRLKMIINSFGGLCTGIVMVVFAVTKFSQGAWVIIILLPVLVMIFFTIKHHYKDLAKRLSLQHYKKPVAIRKQKVIVPVSGVHRGTLEAVRFAKSISNDITAVHVAVDAAEGEKTLIKWQEWAKDVNLVILGSPYRLLYEPLLKYIKTVAADTKANEIVTVVVPEFVPRVGWHSILHTRAAQLLRWRLLFTPKVVIVEVPYVVD
ncbi:MAG: APC family permease [Chloroflexi bacterium]|nr:APC family permease [Chloroflexota bacterium]